MKKMKYNAIPKQEKGPTSKIEAQEWNHIINVLKEQTNFISEVVEDIIKDSEITENNILRKINSLKNLVVGLEKAVEEVVNYKEIHIGSSKPKGKETIWFEIK